MLLLLLQSLFLLLFPVKNVGYPSKLTCSNDLEVGARYMGSTSRRSTDRRLEIKRGTNTLNSFDKYDPGETLIWSVSSTSGEWVIEATDGATVVGSSAKCSGRRIDNSNSGTVVMPNDKDKIITFKIAWASGKSTVFINDEFQLFGPLSTYPPTPAPQVEKDDNDTLGVNLTTAIVSAMGSVLLVIFTILVYIELYKRNQIPDFQDRSYIWGSIGCVFGLIALCFVVEWDFDEHSIWMTAGFFYSQVLAMCSWGFFRKDHETGKIVHVLLQTVATICMIVGLTNVVNKKNDGNAQHLVSLHSWFGVAATAAFSANYLWGLYMATLKALHPNSIVMKAVPVLFVHKMLGITAFASTVIAIETGIMQSTDCYSSYDGSEQDNNPATNYQDLPKDCKIANGLGLLVFITAVFTYAAVFQRNITGKEGENIPEVQMVPSAPCEGETDKNWYN